VAVRFVQGGKLLALATIFRDQESLDAEIEMESTEQAAPAKSAG